MDALDCFFGNANWLLPGGYRSGQTGQTVNLLAMPSQVRILHLPFSNSESGMQIAELNVKIPQSAFRIPHSIGGCSSMVEQQPSKLMTRVRFPSPAFWSC